MEIKRFLLAARAGPAAAFVIFPELTNWCLHGTSDLLYEIMLDLFRISDFVLQLVHYAPI
jgi:hypothetical protein